MAIVHENLTEDEKNDIMADVSHNKVYAQCGRCGIFVVEEESGDGDVYSTLEDYCTEHECSE